MSQWRTARTYLQKRELSQFHQINKTYWAEQSSEEISCEKTSTTNAIDAELSALVAWRDKTRDLKQAAMQELLTERTRLI